MSSLLLLLIQLFDEVFCCDGGRRERLLGQSSLLYPSCCRTVSSLGSTDHLLTTPTSPPVASSLHPLTSADLSVTRWPSPCALSYQYGL